MNLSILEQITQLKEKCACSETELREKLDLSPAEYKGLLCIAEGETVKSNEYSERMGLSPSRGSRVIDKLIEKNFVIARKSKTDKRSVVMTLTDEGVVMKAKVAELKCCCNDKIVNNFSPEEIEEMQRVMGKLIDIL